MNRVFDGSTEGEIHIWRERQTDRQTHEDNKQKYRQTDEQARRDNRQKYLDRQRDRLHDRQTGRQAHRGNGQKYKETNGQADRQIYRQTTHTLIDKKT